MRGFGPQGAIPKIRYELTLLNCLAIAGPPFGHTGKGIGQTTKQRNMAMALVDQVACGLVSAGKIVSDDRIIGIAIRIGIHQDNGRI